MARQLPEQVYLQITDGDEVFEVEPGNTTLLKIEYARVRRYCKQCEGRIPIKTLLFGNWRRPPLYCSDKCKREWYRPAPKGLGSPEEERAAGLYQPCPQCGTEVFRGYNLKRKFCGRECAKKFHATIYKAKVKKERQEHRDWRKQVGREEVALRAGEPLDVVEIKPRCRLTEDKSVIVV